MSSRKYFSGDELRKRRQSRNMTQDDLAGASGVDTTHISKIERNMIDPRIDTVLKLCAALDITLNDLVGYRRTAEVKTYTRTDFIKSLKGLDALDYENLFLYVEYLKSRKKNEHP